MPKRTTSTKHYQLGQQLRSLLRRLPPESLVPTVDELAEQIDGSHGTVMRALSGLAEEGLIVRPAGTKRYRVRTPGDKPSARVAIIRSDYPSAGYESIIREIYAFGKAKGWLFPQHFFSALDKLDLQHFSRGADAVVLLPNAERIPERVLAGLRAPEVPVILLMQHLEGDAVPSVSVDDYQVGYQAVENLLRLGHRRLLLLQDQPDETTIAERLRGWSDAIRAHQSSGVTEVRLHPIIRSNENARSVAYAYFCAWWRERHSTGCQQPLVDAIFTTSATGAQAVLRTLHEENVAVPRTVSVAAFSGETDDCEFALPKLTALGFDLSEYGRLTVRMLERLIARQPLRQMVRRIQPVWIERESTAARSR